MHFCVSERFVGEIYHHGLFNTEKKTYFLHFTFSNCSSFDT